MSVSAKQIEIEALQLSTEERAQLDDKRWSSLEDQSSVDAAWDKEIERRLREIDGGSTQTIPHEDVIAELRARYGK